MDRWLEIDIDWFGSPPWDPAIDEFVDRTLPLLSGDHELRGVCFNVGWLADLITEWSGRPEQPLPLRSRRFARWARLSYEDLRRFLAQVRRSAAAAGIDDLKLGVLVAGLGEVVAPPVTGSMYDLFSDWHDRHPELYPLDISPLPGPDLDPRVPMKSDDHVYATRPRGITEGASFPEFFGGQWGSVARFLGLDLIHLRDGFLGPLLYTRVGPYGTVASDDPDENRTWTDAVRQLFRACKEAHPQGLVMAYSSGISGTAEWLTGCVDLEEIVADGALDIFIDQTWGGAWQDWWDDIWKGWTFQLAYLLGHGAQIRGANERRAVACRHYSLIETWDGWEPWDTLHDTPGKLEWATWAFSHAAVIGREGAPIVPEGTYISWMNDWNGRLISAADVAFLSGHLDSAQASAASIEEVYGPLLVQDRDGAEAVYREMPSSNASAWSEDHAGMTLKFGAALLASTRPEWLPERWADGALWQLPTGRDVARVRALGGPVVATGRADRIDDSWLEAAGLNRTGVRLPAGYRLGMPSSSDLPREERLHLPERESLAASADAQVHYDSDGTILLGGQAPIYHWQPPDLADPGNPLVPHSQIGSTSPYVEAARLINAGAAAAGGLSLGPVAQHEPVTVSCWRSGGVVHLLFGNLESGWMGDARFPRRVSVAVPRDRLGVDRGRAVVGVPIRADWPVLADEAAPDDPMVRLTVTVPPAACLVLRLRAAEGVQ